MELLIRNGFVYDPLNGINGEKMDIAVKNGKIVEKVNAKKAKTVDASRMIVMPGGVDIHCHIAGAEVNTGRLLRPEDHFKDFERKTSVTRSGVGRSIPSTFTTGYRYARMGYTTVMNPSMPPLEAKHTHEELNDTPIVDKATYPLLGDWWHVLELIKQGDLKELALHVAWMMSSTKGYAIFRSRKKENLNAPVEEGQLSCALLHLGNVAYRLGRTLNVDPATGQVISDNEANRILHDNDRGYREPYVVPEEV